MILVKALAGLLASDTFLVITVTPPFSWATTPIAYCSACEYFMPSALFLPGSIYLVVDEAGMLFLESISVPLLPFWLARGTDLATVLVGQIQGIPGKLHTAVAIALGEEAVVVPWSIRRGPLTCFCAASTGASSRSRLTDNLPDQVCRDVWERGCGHCARTHVEMMFRILATSKHYQTARKARNTRVAEDHEVCASLNYRHSA